MSDDMKLHCTTVEESNRKLKLVFSFISKARESTTTSDEYKVGSYAQVSFKFQMIYNTSLECHLASSVNLHTLQDHSKIQVNVTCNVNGVVKQFVCPQIQSKFLDMGHTKLLMQGSNFTVFAIPIEITVDTSIPTPWSSLHNKDSFTDFHLSSENGTVAVHRVVMAHHSEVFETMLNGEWKETAKHSLEVEGVSQQTLQHLKDYMYLGSLPKHEDLRPLLLIAKCYMMQHLEKACSDRLARSVTAEKYRDTLEFAMDNRLQVLMSYMVKYVSAKVVDDSGVLTYPPAARAEAAKEKKKEEPEE